MIPSRRRLLRVAGVDASTAGAGRTISEQARRFLELREERLGLPRGTLSANPRLLRSSARVIEAHGAGATEATLELLRKKTRTGTLAALALESMRLERELKTKRAESAPLMGDFRFQQQLADATVGMSRLQAQLDSIRRALGELQPAKKG
ncbi:hypothetical protein HYS54_01355 [Candidatus Micrarchaeota archaeon]|nr:hypothetical protein [Candidatus Micrarchaeota archaeon]